MTLEDHKMLLCLVDLSLISPRIAFEAVCMAQHDKRDVADLLTEGDTSDWQLHLYCVICSLRKCLHEEPNDWPNVGQVGNCSCKQEDW